MTNDLRSLSEWTAEYGVTAVAIESTGIKEISAAATIADIRVDMSQFPAEHHPYRGQP